MNGTIKRQEHISLGKYFDCRCERCVSPSELGTHLSSLVCQDCDEGFLVLKDPPSNETWICNNKTCFIETNGREIDGQLSTLEDEIDEILYEQSGSTKIDIIEDLLFITLNKFLHKNHFLQIFVKNILIDLYSKMGKKLNEKQLKRKLELCREILKVLDVLESGKTRSRGMALFELARTLECLAKSKTELLELEEILNECCEILGYEDESLVEGKLGKIAREELKEVGLKLNSVNQKMQK
jgi:hypothetical protein